MENIIYNKSRTPKFTTSLISWVERIVKYILVQKIIISFNEKNLSSHTVVRKVGSS